MFFEILFVLVYILHLYIIYIYIHSQNNKRLIVVGFCSKQSVRLKKPKKILLKIEGCNNPSHVTLKIRKREILEISNDSTITDDSHDH